MKNKNSWIAGAQGNWSQRSESCLKGNSTPNHNVSGANLLVSVVFSLTPLSHYYFQFITMDTHNI